MAEIIDLTLAQLEREDDNVKVAPLDLLRLAERDLRADQARGVTLQRMIILVEVSEPGAEDNHLDTYRAGCTQYEEQALLALAADKHLRRWTGQE